VRAAFPRAQIKQTYGLSELGVLRSRSEDDASTWVRIGGDGFEVKVKENLLYVRSEANMIGYLNAPSPFDDEGWMCTGDEVEVRGDYMRILGRKSELINVGGQKVYPAEIETVLLQADNVSDATVFGVPHPIMGHAIHARVTLAAPEDPASVNQRLRTYCSQRLTRHKIPMRFVIAETRQYSARFKKVR
jgi:acyl-CoA synthetase (AMP-forming)/AMP-acid ligase II